MTKRQFKIVLWSIGFALAAAVLLGRAYVVDYYRIPQNGMYAGLPAGSLLFATSGRTRLLRTSGAAKSSFSRGL
jgi:hypothetical protein